MISVETLPRLSNRQRAVFRITSASSGGKLGVVEYRNCKQKGYRFLAAPCFLSSAMLADITAFLDKLNNECPVPSVAGVTPFPFILINYMTFTTTKRKGDEFQTTIDSN
ncbi:MAG: hypothetical protein QOG23_4616 [Blastocatellia bacterium]|nr:hypothetical protein [Blastocatellia bacterium]